jgi:8-oxo-dGTP diphosphatase
VISRGAKRSVPRRGSGIRPPPDVIDVAAAVLLRADGRFLLAQRPADKVFGGYWEFPGGKLEPGELPAHALARELHEELGLDIASASPWLTRVYTYPHGTVRLHFFRVHRWQGDPHGREGQAFSWQRVEAITVAPMLPANEPVLRALALPTEYALSNAAETGDEAFVAALRRRLAEGLRLVQVREKGMARERLEPLAARVVRLVRDAGGIVLLNADEALARAVGADGVHLTAARLATINARPAFDRVGASVHTSAELRRAEGLGIDLAVLGPVHSTPTHPGVPPLGWDGFERIARDAAIPVFAIGGLVPADLEHAWTHGAHGIAMIRGAWGR